MNDYQFRCLLEQLQNREEATEKLDEKIDHLTNDMKIMAKSIKTLTLKLDKAMDAPGRPRKKRKVPLLTS